MPDRHLVPIPLPRGRSGNTGFLSVYFSPRLLEDGALSTYPEWDDWPAALAALNLQVRVNGNVVPHTVVGVAASSAKWNAAFGANTPVYGWRFVDRTAMDFVTFNELAVATQVGAMYAGLAVSSPLEPPTAATLLANPTYNQLLTGGSSASPLPAASAYTDALATPPAPGEEPDIDFHRAVVMLGGHPELLRLLGLVVDMEVTLPAAAPTGVQVRATNYQALFGGGGSVVRDVRPVMHTTTDFVMQPNPDAQLTEQVDWWTELGDGDWDLITSSSLVATQRLGALTASAIGMPGSSGALPAQHEGGVSLLRLDRSAAILNDLVRRRAIEAEIRDFLLFAGPVVQLYAEDVVVGQRIDARDEVTNTWRSIFERTGDQYKFARAPAQNYSPSPDEGCTTFVWSSEQAEAYIDNPEEPLLPTATQRVRDTVFLWDGWSAAAPPPGKVVDGAGEVVSPPNNQPPTASEVKVDVAYTVKPGTLPVLRYGRTYEMRARPVDLAGNSRRVLDVEPAEAVSPARVYGRLAPINPPPIVRRVQKPIPGVGEYVDTIVLLSDYDTPVGAIAPAERTILPPSFGQERCERHGEPNSGIDPLSYDFLAARDALTVEDQCTTDPVSDELISDPALGTIPLAKYLVDCTTSGVTFIGLPLTVGAFVVPWAGAWPDFRGARLIVQATGSGPVLTPGTKGNTLRVTLPKASDIEVDLASAMNEAYIEHFGVWRSLSPAQQTSLRQDVLRGNHWMMSARRVVRMVHAVRRPLIKPVIQTLVAGRPELGSTLATFDGPTAMSRASTDRVTYSAVFTDPIDDPALGPEPSEVTRTAILGTMPVGTPLGGDVLNVALESAAFHDGKHHDLQVTGEAFSRFSRYFTEQTDVTFTTDTVTLDAAGLVESSVVVASGSATLTAGTDYTLDATAGTITRLAGGAIDPGETVTVTFIPLPTSRVTVEGGSPTFAVVVPSSIVPLPLEVREVVPAFSLTTKMKPLQITHDRRGTLVRIWTERGYFRTGAGERVAVVVDSAPGPVPATTRFGRDPVVTGPAAGTPALSSFPRADRNVVGAAFGVNAAGHPSAFDVSRALWSTDVEMSGGLGYRPFVRLTVARLQPDAIAGAKLSTLTDLDPLRLAPSRFLKAARSGGSLTVTVVGPEHEGIPDETNGGALLFNEMTLSFQEADPAITDADLKWQAPTAPQVMTRTPLGGGLTQWRRTTSLAGLVSPVRVLVQETEPSMRRDEPSGVQVAREVVFFDTVDIPPAWLP